MTARISMNTLNRRQFMKLMAAAAAAGSIP
ncbi:MAG: twin-arginine translocation signal domain-containing protein, partial [Oceanospirillales bacterium]|nr:twin-arginine translocation signal domain-containing protein [Oceanospirillales bacterium]